MKIKNLFLVFLLLAFVASCSSDDDAIPIDDDGPNPDPVSGDFFPAAPANSWTYFNESASNDNEEFNGTGTETLSVDEVNEEEVVTFNTIVEGEVAGFFTGALANGTLDKSDDKLRYSGQLEFLEFADTELNIPLTDLLLFDANASAGTELFSGEDGFSQLIPLGEIGTFDMDVTYTLTTTQGEDLGDYMGFENVRTSVMTLSDLSIVVHGTVLGDLQLMQNTTNQVMVSTNYFAEDVGLIKSENHIDIPFINLQETIPIPLPGLPELDAIEFTMTQEITDYSVN